MSSYSIVSCSHLLLGKENMEQVETNVAKFSSTSKFNILNGEVDCFLLRQQVISRLSDLDATLDAGIRHRNNALASIGSHLQQWTIMV